MSRRLLADASRRSQRQSVSTPRYQVFVSRAGGLALNVRFLVYNVWLTVLSPMADNTSTHYSDALQPIHIGATVDTAAEIATDQNLGLSAGA